MIFKKILEMYKQEDNQLNVYLYLSEDSIKLLKNLMQPYNIDVKEFKILIMTCEKCNFSNDEIFRYNEKQPLIDIFTSNQLKAKIDNFNFSKESNNISCYLKLYSPDIDILKNTLNNYIECDNITKNDELAMKIFNTYKVSYKDKIEKLNNNQLYFDKIMFEKKEKRTIDSIFNLKGLK
jgi:hypothetical protein